MPAAAEIKTTSKYEIDMLHGKLMPAILRFSAPLALSGILQLLFNAADIIVVGRFVGADALAAVGSTTSLVNLFIKFFISMSVGVNVCISTDYAAKKYQDITGAVHTAIAISLLGGVLLIFLGISLCRPMLVAMGSPEDILPLSVRYLCIYFCAMPFLLVYNFGAAILRSIGDTRRPFYYLLAAGIVNVILNLFFVLVLDMGVAGVAIATDISNAISAVCVIRALMHEDSCLNFDFKKMGFDPKALRRIFRIGLPAGIQSILFNISNVLIQSSVNSFGALTMAANSASSNLEGFYHVAFTSVTDSVVTFISQNYGAKKYSRLNRIIYADMACILMICAVFSTVYYIFGRQLLSIYTTDPRVTEIGMQRLYVFICGYFLGGFMSLMSGALRGLRKSVLPMVVVLMGAVGFRFVWVYTVFAHHHDYQTLIWGYPISWTLTFLVLLFCYICERNKLPNVSVPPADPFKQKKKSRFFF